MEIEQALQFADQRSEGHTFYEGSQGWRVVCAVLAAEVRRLRASPKPLAEEQTRQGMKDADPAGQDLCRWSFKEGVKFAERAHGIAQGDE